MVRPINLLFLDDKREEISRFRFRLKRYREENHIPVKLTATRNVDKVVRLINDDGDQYDAFISDQNLDGRKGYDLIMYLKKEIDKDLIYAIYTAGDIDETLEERCKANNIILFPKPEYIGFLVREIIKKLPNSSDYD